MCLRNTTKLIFFKQSPFYRENVQTTQRLEIEVTCIVERSKRLIPEKQLNAIMIFLFLLSLFEKLLANPRNLSKYTDIHCTAIQKKMPLLFLHFASASFIRVTSYINFTALSQFKFSSARLQRYWDGL